MGKLIQDWGFFGTEEQQQQTRQAGHIRHAAGGYQPECGEYPARGGQEYHDSSLMKRYVEVLTMKDREKWQLSEIDKAMVKGAEKACEMIEDRRNHRE